MEYASNGKGNAALTTGIIGTSLAGLLTLGSGAGLLGGAASTSKYVSKDELDYVQTIGSKDQQIAILQSENFTNSKIADVYERLKADINSVEKTQNAWNTQQMVNNATMSAAIATNANSIAALQNTCNNLTKTVIPIGNVCPQPMPQYNSWTAPTTPTT